MTGAELLLDAFGRIRGVVHRVLDDLAPEQLAVRLDSEANSIAWLIWHLTRVQDDHLADAADTEQVWLSGGWWERFALPFDRHATGYAHGPDEIGQVRATAEMLRDYHDAVHEQTTHYVRELTDHDLARIVDASWTPPVTLGVRLVSVVADDLQHAGQAAFIRGVIERR